MKTIMLFFSFAIVMLSCKREKIKDQIDTTTKDESIAATVFDDAYNQSEVYLASQSTTKSTENADSTGPVVTIVYSSTDSVSGQRNITLDFGTGITDNYGNTRRGKIMIQATGRYREAGFKRIITFENYSVNAYCIEGSKTITNIGKNSAGQSQFTIKVENGKITTPEGDIITWQSERTRTWIEGEATGRIWDDVYEITGSGSGVNSEGNNYTITIKTALKVKLTCRHIVEGEIEMNVDDIKEPVTINYGSGDCDAQATIRYKKQTRTISLRN